MIYKAAGEAGVLEMAARHQDNDSRHYSASTIMKWSPAGQKGL